MKLSEIKRLDEMAVAAYGNWQISDDIVAYRSVQVIKSYYEFVDNIKLPVGIKQVMKLENRDYYVAGEFVSKEDETKFEEIFQITFKPTRIPNIEGVFMCVEGVKVPEYYRGLGIALTMYRFFSHTLKFKILGDDTSYFGAKKLWAKLSKMVDVMVDIIDFTTGKMLEEDIVLHHGSEDWEFDDRVWSYDVDKKYIRLILKDI